MPQLYSEWRDLDPSQKDEKFPKYAAISHSWMLSAEVQRLSSTANRLLNIEIGQDIQHQVSWHGLCQAARPGRRAHNAVDHSSLDAARGDSVRQHSRVNPPSRTGPGIHSIHSSGPTHNIKQIEGELALSELRGLLRCRWGLTIDSKKFVTRCFGDDEAMISSLEDILHGRDAAMKRAAAWRNIWLRTSKQPQDMVFSLMHLLGVHIDVDYTRNRADLILELVRKSASLPSWLDIGGDVPFDCRYGLLSAITPFHPHQTPAYIVGDQPVPVGQYVTTEEYISKFDIKILTPATAAYDGDLVCAEIFEVHRDSSGNPSLYIAAVGRYLNFKARRSWDLMSWS